MATSSKRAANAAHNKIIAACRKKSDGILALAAILYTVLSKQLYAARGHMSFAAYVNEELPIGLDSARKYIQTFKYSKYLTGLGVSPREIYNLGYTRLNTLSKLPWGSVNTHLQLLRKAVAGKWSARKLGYAVQTAKGVVPGFSDLLTGLHTYGSISREGSDEYHRCTKIIGGHLGVNDAIAALMAVRKYAAQIVTPPVSHKATLLRRGSALKKPVSPSVRRKFRGTRRGSVSKRFESPSVRRRAGTLRRSSRVRSLRTRSSRVRGLALRP